MEAEPLSKSIYNKAKKLGIDLIILHFSGGSDEGYLSIETSPKHNQEFNEEIDEWAWSAYHYSGAGDGSDYGDDITYNLKTNEVSTEEWYHVVQNDEPHTSKLKISEINPQHHRCEENLNHTQDGHDAWLPIFRPTHKQQAYHCMPKGPQQERPFLTFPQTAEYILHGHGIIQMFPSVFVFVIVIKKNEENREDHSENGKGMNSKTPTCPWLKFGSFTLCLEVIHNG